MSTYGKMGNRDLFIDRDNYPIIMQLWENYLKCCDFDNFFFQQKRLITRLAGKLKIVDGRQRFMTEGLKFWSAFPETFLVLPYKFRAKKLGLSVPCAFLLVFSALGGVTRFNADFYAMKTSIHLIM